MSEQITVCFYPYNLQIYCQRGQQVEGTDRSSVFFSVWFIAEFVVWFMLSLSLKGSEALPLSKEVSGWSEDGEREKAEVRQNSRWKSDRPVATKSADEMWRERLHKKSRPRWNQCLCCIARILTVHPCNLNSDGEIESEPSSWKITLRRRKKWLEML